MKREINANSSSLFHFTKRFNILKRIISDGIRFSFAYETLAELIKDMGFALPMVSFCDIPITRTSRHKKKYGEYMIGLDKEFLIDCYNEIINPVIYVHSVNLQKAVDSFHSLNAKLLDDMVNTSGFRPEFEHKGLEILKDPNWEKQIERLANYRFYMMFILGLTKPYYDEHTKECYYDEREWRAFWPDHLNENTDWKWPITREIYDGNKDAWNEDIGKNKENYITLSEGYLYYAITHIVVKKESQRQEIINLIMNSKTIFGCENVSKEERLILVSKVSSFECIDQDY